MVTQNLSSAFNPSKLVYTH